MFCEMNKTRAISTSMTCIFLFCISIHFQGGYLPAGGLTEMPTCPVCLERMV